MAKDRGQPSSDKEIKKLLESLYNAVQLMNTTSKETVRVNRDLLKVMALLEAGFATSKDDAQDLIEQVGKGLEITDALTIKWAKSRKIAKEDLDSVLKKYRELEQLDEDSIANAKDYLDLLKDRNDYLGLEFDLSKKLLSSSSAILKIISQSKGAAAQLSSGFKDSSEALSALISKKVDLSGLFNDTLSSVEKVDDLIAKIGSDIGDISAKLGDETITVDLQFNPLSDQLDKEVEKVLQNVQDEKNARLKGLQEYFEKDTKLQTQLARQMAASMKGMNIVVDVDTGDLETATGILKKGTAEFKNMADQLDKISESNNLVSKLGENFKTVVDLVGLGTNRTEEQTNTLNKMLVPMGLASKIIVDQIEDRQFELGQLRENLIKQKGILKVVTAYSTKFQTVKSIVEKVSEGFDHLNSIMPTGISEFIGLSKVSQSLMESHRRGIEDFTAELSESGDKAKAMNGYFKAFEPALKLAINPLMLGVVAATLLYKFVENITEKYKEMASTMKISLGQSQKLYKVQLDTVTSQKNQFSTMEDIQEIQTAMIGSSGKVFDLTNKDAKELTLNISEVGKYFGYGNEEAVKLHKTFTNLGASNDLAIQLQRNVGYMAEMAGLAPQIISQDLIDGAEEVSIYFAGMPDQAAKAVIQIRRMGMSLKQAGQIAQKMLDLEGFMTDMYELQAMTGGGIDFSAAFDKGLTGDIEGMTKEIMESIGTTAEYNKMDYLTRMKIAKTLGMSSEELGKSVALNEKMVGLDSKSQEYLNANLDRMGDISAMSQKDIRSKMQALQSTDRLGIAWDKIKATLIDALLPFVESFAEGINLISPILDVIIMGFKGIGAIIKVVAFALQPIMWVVGRIGDGLSIVTGKLDEVGDAAGGLGSIFGTVLKAIIGVGQVIVAWKTLKFFGVIQKDGLDVIKMIPGIGTIAKKVFGGVSTDAAVSSTIVAQKSAETVASVSTSASVATKKVADNIQENTAKVAKAASKMSQEVQTVVKDTQAKIKTGSKLSFMSSDTAKATFGTIGSIASKTFAIMAVKSASSFFTMRKEGEEQTSAMTDNMGGMFDMAFMGAGSLLATYLQEGIEKVFTKKIEGHIEGKLEAPIKNLSKKFSTLDKPADTAFGRIAEKGKSAFSKIFGFAKKMLPGATTSISGTFDNMASSADKVLPKIESVQQVTSTIKNKTQEIVESTTKKTTDKVPPITSPKTVKLPDPAKPIKTVESKIGSGFDSITKVLNSAWNGIKTVLTDIVKFVSTSMKELSSGIGTSIKNVLKGIGDGLSSFKGSAIKGAAALVILSGAIWIASKALKNFSTVNWEDIAKAGVTLGGLVGAAMLLGSASPMMIVGAAGIALLGASLIPAAYALNMFNDVEWGSLAKAGIALIGLGTIGTALGASAPMMIIGAVGITALSASLIPMAFALNKFNEVDWGSLAKAGASLLGLATIGTALGVLSPMIVAGSAAMAAASIGIYMFSGSLGTLGKTIETLSFEPLKDLTVNLIGLTAVPILNLFGIAAGIGAIAASFLSFSAVSAVGNIISSVFGGDIVKDLERLANLADPLAIVNNVLKEIGNTISNLSQTIESIDFSKFGNLKEIGDIGIEAKVQQKMEPIKRNMSPIQGSTPSQNIKISPSQPQVANVRTPNKASVAQDKIIDAKKVFELERQEKLATKRDTYEKEDMVPEVSKSDMLLMEILNQLKMLNMKETDLILDGVKVNSSLKKHNNNK